MDNEYLEYKNEPFLKSNNFGIYPLSDHGFDKYTQDSYVQKYLKSTEHHRIKEFYSKNQGSGKCNGNSEDENFNVQYYNTEPEVTSFNNQKHPEIIQNMKEEPAFHKEKKETIKNLGISQYFTFSFYF